MTHVPRLTVAGATVEPYVQLYESSGVTTRSAELLSRPEGVDHVEEFFDSLTYDQHAEILAWQLGLKEEFTERTGCRLSINIDNELISTMDERLAFLDLVGNFPTPTTFEFTETHPMPPAADANLLLRNLREIGHKSALDDFGTGLNGMSLLTDYDFDVVKVDRSLIYDIGERLEKRKTVTLIRQMVEVLGKGHVVEGVDSPEIHALLKKAGFKVFQGYHFHRPEPMERVAELLSEEVSA